MTSLQSCELYKCLMKHIEKKNYTVELLEKKNKTVLYFD